MPGNITRSGRLSAVMAASGCSTKPDGVSPILPPLALKGHRDSPPSTTAAIKPGKANNPPPSLLGPE